MYFVYQSRGCSYLMIEKADRVEMENGQIVPVFDCGWGVRRRIDADRVVGIYPTRREAIAKKDSLQIKLTLEWKKGNQCTVCELIGKEC